MNTDEIYLRASAFICGFILQVCLGALGVLGGLICYRLKNSSSALTYWNVGFQLCPASGIVRSHFGSFAAA
jgi:hypothetical protein